MDDYFENFIKDITKMRKRFMESRQQQADSARKYNNKFREQYHTDGQLVYLEDHEIQQDVGHSTRTNFSGPYIIEQVLDGNRVCLKSVETTKVRVAHKQHLKLSKGPFTQIPLNTKIETSIVDKKNDKVDNALTETTVRRSPRLNTHPSL